MLVGCVKMCCTVSTDNNACCTCFFNNLFHIILNFFLCTCTDKVCIVVSETADNAFVIKEFLTFRNRNALCMYSPVDYAEIIIFVDRQVVKVSSPSAYMKEVVLCKEFAFAMILFSPGSTNFSYTSGTIPRLKQDTLK